MIFPPIQTSGNDRHREQGRKLRRQDGRAGQVGLIDKDPVAKPFRAKNLGYKARCNDRIGDLYDGGNGNFIPWDKLEEFFKENLK